MTAQELADAAAAADLAGDQDECHRLLDLADAARSAERDAS